MVNKLTTGMSLTGNGLRDWLAQRLSSLILAMYFLVLLGFFLLHPRLDHAVLRYFFASIWMQVFTFVALLNLFLHAWIGIWTVITDYIRPTAMRLVVQVFVFLALVIYFFWGVEILWKLV